MKEKIYSNKLVLTILIILSINSINAVNIGSDSSRGVKIIQPEVSINYSTVNTNNSQYLQSLTPQQVANLFDASAYYLKSNPYNFLNSTNNPNQYNYYNSSTIPITNINGTNINVLTINATNITAQSLNVSGISNLGNSSANWQMDTETLGAGVYPRLQSIASVVGNYGVIRGGMLLMPSTADTSVTYFGLFDNTYSTGYYFNYAPGTDGGLRLSNNAANPFLLIDSSTPISANYFIPGQFLPTDTSLPSSGDFRMSGTGNKIIGQGRRITGPPGAGSLTINSGGAKLLTTNNNGGNLILVSGISTGTGTSSILFQTATAGGSGTADNTPTTKMILDGSGSLNVSGGVNASYFVGDGSKLTNVASNINNTNINVLTINSTSQNINGNANVTGNVTASIHITKIISGEIYGTCTNSSGYTFTGNLSTGAICNL